jgi:hypothetical protein
MKILYYTSGTTGSGRVVRGISIGNALQRKGLSVDFTILSSCPFAHLADRFHFNHREIPAETEEKLTPDTFHSSTLYRTLTSLKPDILLIDLLWFPLYHFIHELPGKKIFLWQQMDERFFSIALPSGTIVYNPELYNLVVAIEPFDCSGPERQVNPLILRNRDEILPRKQALEELGLQDTEQNCLLAYNGPPGDFERVQKKYAYLSGQGYKMVATTNYRGGIFPIVDYFNAFDLILCGASYNSFWEAIFFNKKAIFIPTQTRFVDVDRLIKEYRDYQFDENGADQLVDIISTF